ncbi:hypothetical protein AAFF_G00437540 [Aldrovandia affinis]|uniref:Secreted protein n=1 Tax=Aldrovandia affinis TaxID=143900 RepID=A0AAD7S7S5_9TELE|nr:hypothetical protein AAFF_G00437540 [Aldrovandia affinis]
MLFTARRTLMSTFMQLQFLLLFLTTDRGAGAGESVASWYLCQEPHIPPASSSNFQHLLTLFPWFLLAAQCGNDALLTSSSSQRGLIMVSVSQKL